MSRGRRPARRRLRPAGPWQGVELEVDVDAVAHGGHCVARHEGRVLFVRHTLPGERVRVLVTEDGGGSYCRADAIAVLRAAPERVAPPCPWSGPGRCGGCDFQHVDPAAQRAIKAAVVREQFARLGGLPGLDVVVEPLPGTELGWRTRMHFAVDRSGRAGLRRHRSHYVVPVTDCPIAHPDVDAADVLSRSWPGASGVHVAVSGSGQRAVRPGGSAADALTERAAGRDWRVGADGFWQVHPGAADALVGCLMDLVAPRPGERVLELYAGVGLFGGVLAGAVGPTGRVRCVEADPVAAREAVHNLAGTPWASVLERRVDAAWLAGLDPVELVVLDPPRSGAGREVSRAVAGLATRAIGYVACDPAALARDVRTFTEAGWTLDALRAFDAFPMTHHVECVAVLTPENSPEGS